MHMITSDERNENVDENICAFELFCDASRSLMSLRVRITMPVGDSVGVLVIGVLVGAFGKRIDLTVQSAISPIFCSFKHLGAIASGLASRIDTM